MELLEIVARLHALHKVVDVAWRLAAVQEAARPRTDVSGGMSTPVQWFG